MRPRITLSLAGLGLLMSVALVGAEPGDSAGTLFGEGIKLFATKDYKEAAIAFEASYQAKPEQRTLYAWAQATRFLGQCEKSRELLAMYVAKGANRNQSRAAYKLMEDCQPAPPEEEQAAPTTEGAGTETDPQSTTSEADDPEAMAGTTTEIPSDVTGPDGEPSSTGVAPWYKDWVAVSLLSVGVVGLGVGGLSYSSALSLESEGMENGTSYDEFLALQAQSEDDRRLAVIFGTGGVLCIGAGITYLLLRDTSGRRESSSLGQSFSVNVDGQSAGFALRGHF